MEGKAQQFANAVIDHWERHWENLALVKKPFENWKAFTTMVKENFCIRLPLGQRKRSYRNYSKVPKQQMNTCSSSDQLRHEQAITTWP